jgi:cyclase
MGLGRSLSFARVGSHSEAVLGAGEDVLHSYGSNQGIVSSDRASVIIDSGFHNRVASEILRRVRASRPKLFVLNTHYHSDHVFGNSILSKAGASIIAHEKCRKSMRKQSQKLLDGYRRRDPRISRLLQNVEIAYPDITYRDRLSFHLGDNLNAEIIHPEVRAHTDGDSMLFVREDRVLFAGDVVWVGYHPNLEDADIQGQVRALRTILRLKPRRIVPGHGPVCGLREVRRLIRYLEEFDESRVAALKEGLTGDRLVRRVIPRWSAGWRMRWLAESHIQSMAKSSV